MVRGADMKTPAAGTSTRARAESVAACLRNLLASRSSVLSGAGTPGGVLERTSSVSGVSIMINVSGDSIDSVVVRRDDGVVAGAGAMPVARAVSSAESESSEAAGALETTAIDQDWSTREGYDRSFIGKEVPIPKLTDAQEAITAVVPTRGG